MASNWHFSKADNHSDAVMDVPSELKPLKLCIFKRLQLSAVNNHCSHMRSRHIDLMAHDENDQIVLAGERQIECSCSHCFPPAETQVIVMTSKAQSIHLLASV
jgi:hypothetical protein